MNQVTADEMPAVPQSRVMSFDFLFDDFDRLIQSPESVHRLRRFILDLAVRGKLAPQDPNDEPASELLKRIAAEKVRLVKAGEIRKPKAKPALTAKETPFTLPENWKWSQIAEIGVLSPRNNAEDGTLASFVPMPMIATDYGVASNHEVRRWGDIKKGYTHFAEGDVGLAKITPCFQNGKSTVFRNLTGGLGSGTTELHIARPLLVKPNFILLFLKCPYFIDTGVPKMTGTAGQKRVPAEYFAYSPFPLPPLAEQHRIVAKVDELMALCDRLEATRSERRATRDRFATASLARLNTPDPDPETFRHDVAFALNNLAPLTTRPDQIKALRQTILYLAVRGKLVPQDPNEGTGASLLAEIEHAQAARSSNRKLKKTHKLDVSNRSDVPFQMPRNWASVRIGHALELVNGRAFKPSDWTQSGLPIVRIQNLNNPYATFNCFDGDVKEKFLIDNGDFLISWSGTPGTSFGAHIWRGGPAVLNQHIFKATLIGNVFDPRFLKPAINARLLELIEQAQGGVGLQHITKPKLEAVVLTLPPLAEQRRIVAKVDELMALCDQLEANLMIGDPTRHHLIGALLHEALAHL